MATLLKFRVTKEVGTAPHTVTLGEVSVLQRVASGSIDHRTPILLLHNLAE